MLGVISPPLWGGSIAAWRDMGAPRCTRLTKNGKRHWAGGSAWIPRRGAGRDAAWFPRRGLSLFSWGVSGAIPPERYVYKKCFRRNHLLHAKDDSSGNNILVGLNMDYPLRGNDHAATMRIIPLQSSPPCCPDGRCRCPE